MKRRLRNTVVPGLMLLAALPASAQFTLNVVDASGEHAAPPIYDLGQSYANEVTTATFRLRNTSSAAATVSVLAAAGAGFVLSGPALPVGLAPGDALPFTVTFSASDLGAYSAVLRCTGVSILLTATVAPRLTYSVDSASGALPLSTVDFGSVVRGGIVTRRILIQNGTPLVLTIPAISVQGAGFTLTGVPPSGQVLSPQQIGEFSLAFSPPASAAYTGTLIIGDRSYPLTGAATDPALPKPSISIHLNSATSLQQGSVTIGFDAPAQTGGVGTVTLDFQGAFDPAIAFASGGRTATFAVLPGDTQASLAFQPGTTAGVLTFTVQLGAGSDTKSVSIAAAPPVFTAVQGSRGTGSLQLVLTGFDDTRTAGALTFTFYDTSGVAIAPGAISTDVSAGFARYFAGSNLGGVFLLNAVFPITGDVSRVAACDVTLLNSAGTAKAPRIQF
jgi:hypothetical protein